MNIYRNEVLAHYGMDRTASMRVERSYYDVYFDSQDGTSFSLHLVFEFAGERLKWKDGVNLSSYQEIGQIAQSVLKDRSHLAEVVRRLEAFKVKADNRPTAVQLRVDDYNEMQLVVSYRMTAGSEITEEAIYSAMDGFVS